MTAIQPRSPRARTLSKSDFKLARTCETKLYFRENRYQETTEYDPYLQMLAAGGYMVEALAKAHYPDGTQLEYGRGQTNDAELTRSHLEQEQVTLFEGTLLWNRRLARADILQKSGSRIRLIEVKAKSFDGAAHFADLAAGGKGVFQTRRGISSDFRKYLEDITFQVLILERMLPGIDIEPVLCLVDKSKRTQLSDVPRLFKVERRTDRQGVERLHTAHFLGDSSMLPNLDVLTEVNVSAEVELLREEVEAEAERFELLLDSPRTAFNTVLAHACKECEFRLAEGDGSGFHECWGAHADTSPHVLDLFRIDLARADGRTLIESMLAAGTASLLDIPDDQLAKKDGSVGPVAERQRRQVLHARSGEFWISNRLKERLESVEYPAHFADFEVARLALPYHSGMRPYGQVAFQWSNHTVSAPGVAPVHSEWLNTEYEWPNEKFARALRERIGDTGSVLTWSKFERTTLREVIRELGHFGLMDQELADWIENVAETRIVDMCEWAQYDFYHPAMQGKSSIKVVLDALWKSDPDMRAQFEKWTGLTPAPDQDPYAALPPLKINGVLQDVREGTGAIRAYEAMMYGVEKDDEKAKSDWQTLLRQYCGLDSLSMVLIFEHVRRRSGVTK